MFTLYREDSIQNELGQLVDEIKSLDKWLDIDLESELRDKIIDILESCDDRYETIMDIKAAGYGQYLPIWLQ